MKGGNAIDIKNATENEIVDHIISNWKKFFGKFNMHFQKKEYYVSVPRRGINSRIDILAYKNKKDINFRIPIMIECKFSQMNSSRDILLELEKLKKLRQYHNDKMIIDHADLIICVLADQLKPIVMNYMIENDMHWFKYGWTKDNIGDLPNSIEYVKHKTMKESYMSF